MCGFHREKGADSHASIDLKSRLRRCFEPLRSGKVFYPATVFLQLAGLFACNVTRELQMAQPLTLSANSWIKTRLSHILGQIPATT